MRGPGELTTYRLSANGTMSEASIAELLHTAVLLGVHRIRSTSTVDHNPAGDRTDVKPE